ncbi:MAG: class I mannose-6-phosphate isomerase [Candidatus Eremiobacteraeota bacterium]|nr:class I mannose-6-phosphate isomerase [Candidatus Eremiobacteraeota bacterium]
MPNPTLQSLQPLVMAPKLTPAIWGGDALVRSYGKNGDPKATLGETWECWDENAVRGGAYDGKTLAELRALLGARLMGTLDPNRIFPVLTKIIDARQSLSVQVHPDDAYAQRVEHQPFGKTECWVILAAEPGAELVLGWTHATTREEYERRVNDGTLGDILRRVKVKPNDAFYLPSGTLHAIGAGIQLFETQQASDLTYRIFDWNRVGPDGKPRQLHVEKAADVLNYSAGTTSATDHLEYIADDVRYETCIADPRFVVEKVVPGADAVLRPDGEPIIFMTMDREMTLDVGGGQTDLPRWTTALIPAEIEAVRVLAEPGDSALCVTPSRTVFIKRTERSEISRNQRENFLGQFATAAVMR